MDILGVADDFKLVVTSQPGMNNATVNIEIWLRSNDIIIAGL